MDNSADDFLVAFAREVKVSAPSAAELETLLDVAGLAAHSSERWAAPITCWMVGRAGLSADDAMSVAKRVAAELRERGDVATGPDGTGAP